MRQSDPAADPRTLPLQINQDRAIHIAFAQREIVHPEYAGDRGRRNGSPPDNAEQRVGADRHVQALRDTGTGFPTDRKGEVVQRCRQSYGASCRYGHHGGQAFGEGLLGTVGHKAAKAPDVEAQLHRVVTDGHTPWGTRVIAMHAARQVLTVGTAGTPRTRMGSDHEGRGRRCGRAGNAKAR